MTRQEAKKTWKPETLCIQSGWEPKNGEPRVAPLYQSTTYKYDSADDVAALFKLTQAGHFYSRLSNPTCEILEKKITDLEGGVGACALSAGMTATFYAILNLANPGEEIVCTQNLYGGSYTMIKNRLPLFGIEPHFVPLNDFEALEAAITPKTRLIFGETLSNPGVEVMDLERYAEIAHAHGIPLVVDNTFATPVLCRPFDFGVDIVTEASTKYLDGHGTSVGGIVIDSGHFDWEANGYKQFYEPDPSYSNISYTEAFGDQAFVTRLRSTWIRDLGGIMAPFNAYLTNLGMETLGVRMAAHSQNALKVAEYLESNPQVEWVSYPGLKSSPYHDLAQKYLPKGQSGVISFSIRGDAERAKRWIDRLNLATLVVHVGDLRTYVLQPATMTHSQMSEEELKAAGISPGQIRLSVGLEDVDDIIADLDQAFQALD